jgi:hypothetical protein
MTGSIERKRRRRKRGRGERIEKGADMWPPLPCVVHVNKTPL